MDKILTIVVPTYNMEKYLDKCLTSLIVDDAGLMKKLEVLVVIDGATDRSSEIAHTYQDRFPDTFRVIDKENGNYGSCVNRGLKEAAGKYIKILDADDSFDTANFKEFLKFLLTVDVDCVISDRIDVDAEGGIIEHHNYKLLPKDNVPFTLKDLCKEAMQLNMHSLCYKTSNVRMTNYHQTEGISYTDQEWICFPMISVKRIVYVHKVVYRYFIGRSDQTVNLIVWERNFNQYKKVVESMFSQYKNISMDCNEEIKHYIKMRIILVIKGLYSLYLRKFSTYGYNDCMKEFDLSLKEQDLILYEELGAIVKCCGVHYVKHWRKDYKENTMYLNMIRRFNKMESSIFEFFKKLF